jgi:glycosyltransferase involved in cell wall biosynthesis
MPRSLSLILPAYEEARVIAGTLAAARAHLVRRGGEYEILVPAEGRDGTHEAARAAAQGDANIIVFGEERRGGKGRAVREAVARARGDLIGYADADGKVPFEEMDRLLPWLDAGYDLVIGSRVREGARVEREAPLHRRLGSLAFGAAVRLLVRLDGISDTQCGFKFFRAEAARRLFARQRIDGYMFDVELLRLAQRGGLRVKEVGVRWAYDGDSRLEMLRGNWRNAVDLLKIALQSTNTSSSGMDRKK